MERLICLLPSKPDESWELMTDQYKCSLWDIYPDTQVCGVGENDTIVLDGAKGALIQWSMFSPLRTMRKLTTMRRVFLYAVLYSPILFFIAIGLISVPGPTRKAGIAILVLTLTLLQLPAPYYIWRLYGGKLWAVEPSFFGIEGYVPIEIIEEKLFGKRMNRMRWSPFGSPLMRHTQGEPCHERRVQYPDYADQMQPEVDVINTYPVQAIDPTSECTECVGHTTCIHHETVISAQEKSHSPMGETKVFTLVDSFNMTATLFHAVRPPTALIIGGSEGGMKRAIACSLDASTGTFYRETVLRIPSQSVERMDSLPRVRLGIRRPFLHSDVRLIQPKQPVYESPYVANSTRMDGQSMTETPYQTSQMRPQQAQQQFANNRRSPVVETSLSPIEMRDSGVPVVR